MEVFIYLFNAALIPTLLLYRLLTIVTSMSLKMYYYVPR